MDSAKNSFIIPKEKIQKIRQEVGTVLVAKAVTAKQSASKWSWHSGQVGS
jgi:hypothetical protein